jgi:hypothetical protein
MKLLHTTDQENIINILRDGYLRSSVETKNIRMFGQPHGSSYIYLRIAKNNDYGNLVLSSKLLLNNSFYLNTGWKAEPDNTKLYNGFTLNKKNKNNILKNFSKKVFRFYKKMPFPLVMMSNEILVNNPINLYKYLKKVYISEFNQEINDIIKKYYPDVQLVIGNQ